jgi:transketolase
VSAAIEAGIAETEKPTLISVKSIIGWPAPNKQNSSKAHGSPLGADEVRETKEALGWDPDKTFFVPDGVYEAFLQKERGGELRAEWNNGSTRGARATPSSRRSGTRRGATRPGPARPGGGAAALRGRSRRHPEGGRQGDGRL